jgi:lipoteichoic acid synthase
MIGKTFLYIKDNKKLHRHSRRLTFADIIFAIFFIVSLLAKTCYFQFTSNLVLNPLLSQANLRMFLTTLFLLVIFSALVLCIFNKYRRGVFVASNLIFSFIIFADTLYFRYFSRAITIPVLFLVTLAGEAGESVVSILRAKDFLLFLDLPLWIIISRAIKSKWKFKRYIPKTAMVLLLVLMVGISAFYFSNRATSADSMAYNDDNYIISQEGLLYFHYYDMVRFVDENFLKDTELSVEEREKLTKFYEGRQKESDRFFGEGKGRNVIVVQMEAIQNFLINLEVGDKEVTPNLNRLVNDFVYFNNLFFQVAGGNTSDAEFLSNNSLYPVDNGSVYYRFPNNKFISLPSLLKKEGYYTSVYHAFEREYWNRDEFYKTILFDSYLSKDDFDNTEELGWGLSDKEFLRQTAEFLSQSEQPFYSFIITLSSHHPFSYFQEFDEIDAGELEGTLIGNYLEAAHYVDKAIGAFIQDLKSKGLYDNSIIVLYGDHGAIQRDELELISGLLQIEPNEPEWRKLQEVPLFIRWPGMQDAGVNSTVGGQIDILPTICNILGIKTPFAMGKDLFNTKREYAVFRNHDVVTKQFIYINAKETIYDWNGNELDFEEYIDEINLLLNELEVSDIILENDAFKNINNNSINEVQRK